MNGEAILEVTSLKKYFPIMAGLAVCARPVSARSRPEAVSLTAGAPKAPPVPYRAGGASGTARA